MNRLSLLFLKSFMGPFIVTFFVSLFVLVMQFLFMYIDDMVGKGLSYVTITQLMLYMSVTLIPLALPLAVLLSSIMTFGNLGEHFELVSIKSAGISLIRAMRPLIVLIFFLCVVAFMISNYLMPSAHIKASSLLQDVRSAKPTFELRDNVFNTSLPEIAIRISSKEKKGNKVNDILIYDHRDNLGNNKVITAKTGEFYFTDDRYYVKFDLYNGVSYEELNPHSHAVYPMTIMEFDKQQIIFDISDFKFERSDESLFHGHSEMLRADELQYYIDSMKVQLINKYKVNYTYLLPYFHLNDTTFKNLKTEQVNYTKPDFIDNIKTEFRKGTIARALDNARIVRQSISYGMDDTESYIRMINRYRIEWHRKFTLSFAILVLFFVGAPFGAIVKKGGLGMPMVISILLFITYHILSMIGEKISKETDSNVFFGMWAASFILLPVGIFLTYKANSDARIFNKEIYFNFWTRFLSWFGK